MTNKTTGLMASSSSLPSDPLLALQWYLGDGPWSINIKKAWEDYGGAGVRVGVLDSGFNYIHPDLSANYRTDLDYDFTDEDNDAFNTGANNNHGTAVMGLIGADDNGIGTVGVAHDADLVGYRVDLSKSSALTAIIRGFSIAENEVDILNNSWGFASIMSDNLNRNGLRSFWSALENLAEDGRDGLGTITVVAGGNNRASGDSANYHNFQNSPYTIAVGAMDEDGTYSSFSSPGSSLLITAPG
ncbi:MAG: S8 family serine peptidase, partial [Magnetococcus sp. WYHC-3]